MNRAKDIRTFLLHDGGRFPNNPRWPLLVYPAALSLSRDDAAGSVERLFEQNGWSGMWRNGIYPFHHYHSNAHEALGVFSGTARVQFGGPAGVELTLKAGDVAVLPAGTTHRNLGSSNDFGVVGAYPSGAAYDLCYGKPHERPGAIENIANAVRPETDPVFGTHGGLCVCWTRPLGRHE